MTLEPPAPAAPRGGPGSTEARRAPGLAWARSWPALAALAGLALGGVLLWLALRGISAAELADAAKRVHFRWIAAAMLFYWAGLVLHSERWRGLLESLEPAPSRRDRYNRACEALLVGHAVNHLLPGRLGELVRADHAGKRLPLTPVAVFGTVIIERLFDAIIVAAALCIGLAALALLDGGVVAPYRTALAIVGACGGVAVLGAAAAACGVMRYPQLLDRLSPAAARLGCELRYGLACFGYAELPRLIGLSLAIRLLGAAAIWSLARAVGVTLGPAETAILVGALSLGALLPTAPAHLGLYQLIFAVCLASFGLPAASGIVAASLLQVFLLAPVTIAGLLLYCRPEAVAALRLAGRWPLSAVRAG